VLRLQEKTPSHFDSVSSSCRSIARDFNGSRTWSAGNAMVPSPSTRLPLRACYLDSRLRGNDAARDERSDPSPGSLRSAPSPLREPCCLGSDRTVHPVRIDVARVSPVTTTQVSRRSRNDKELSPVAGSRRYR
jgi:hypothetical protein